MRKENADFQTAFLSEEGSKLLNRDYFAYVELDDFACYAAADSLDGEKGRNSAKIAVECILREFTEHPSIRTGAIRKNLKKAHRELEKNREGMRLRASAAVIVTNYVKFRYACIGNSRAALIRNDRILYESKDQSLTENLVEEEKITKDKAAAHEERNNLYSYLGQTDRRPEIKVSRKKKLADGDIFTLYTRGIWENCDQAELLDAAKEVSAPQEMTDNIEELILGKRNLEIDNYTIAVTFVNKVYRNPKKRWTLKKTLALVIPAAMILLILGITLFMRFRIRSGREKEMLQHIEGAEKYIACENFDKAAQEYGQAKELAVKLKEEEKQEEIEESLLLTEQILLADETMAEGDYGKAQELYVYAKTLSTQTGGCGEEYIDGRLEKAGNYLEIFELLESGERKEDYGDYAGAIELYRKAKQMASGLYDKETKNEALEKQRAAEEALEQIRQEELAELEKRIEDAIEEEQVALDLENQSLMNDKKNALELEGKGNELMKNEDYQSAIPYFETAAGMYGKLDMPERVQTLGEQIEACRKLAEEAEKKAAAEAAQQSAEAEAAEDAKKAAEEARKAMAEMKDAEKDRALEEAKLAAEEAKKAAEEAKKAVEKEKEEETEEEKEEGKGEDE